MMNDDDVLTSDQYEVISSVVKWFIYEILVLFPKLKKEEWNTLLRNVVLNNLTQAQALILQDPRNDNARLAIKGLTALWNDPSKLNSYFTCTLDKMHEAITTCIETITNGQDDDIVLDEIRNHKLSKKQQDETDFNAFKIAYYKDFRSKWWSNPWSTMKMLIEKGTITTMDEVRAYAHEHPSRRTARIIKNLFPNDTTSDSSADLSGPKI